MKSIFSGVGVCALVLSGVSSAALAQSTEAVPAAGASPAATESAESDAGEIIVTAQRKEERLSRAPVAVSFLSGELLERSAIKSQGDLQIATPGLVVKSSVNSNDLNYAIRGQSLDAFSGTRPGVLPYFNEVQIGGQGTSSSFYDLQSIQVLKGPQGTLFGRNSTGGAVVFTSASPKPEFGGYASVNGGNFGTYGAEGALNVPLAGSAAILRVAGVYQKNNGYQRNIFNGGKFGDAERTGLRGSLRLEPSSTIRNDLVVDYYRATGTNMSPVLTGINTAAPFPIAALYSNTQPFPAGAVPPSGPYLSDFITSQVLQGPPGFLPAATANALANGNYLRFIASFNNPAAVPVGGLAQILADQIRRGPYVANSANPNTFKTRNFIVTNVTTIDVGPDTTLKNIIGYTNLKSFSNVDYDGTPFRITDTGTSAASGNTVNADQFSEELQLSGKTAGGNLNYVGGFYYSLEHTYNNLTSQAADVLLGGFTQFLIYRRTNTTYAGYGQGTYDLSDATGVEGLSITAGARYSSEKVRNEVLPGHNGYRSPQLPGFQNDQSKTFKNVSWTFGLQDQINPNLLIYVKSRRSYKNGGFNGQADPRIGFAEINGNSYRTETLTDAELGVKYSGAPGGTPLHLNLAIYNDWIKNSQRTAYFQDPTTGALLAESVTVPRANVFGVELDGDIRPASWLTIGGSVNYTKPKFTQGLTAIAGTTALFDSYPDTSEWSGAFYADVSVPLTDTLTASAHGDVFAQTSQFYYSSQVLDPGTITPGYALVNFRIGVESEQGWSLTANLKNAFNRVYFTGGFPVGGLLATNTGTPGLPRTFLVTARYKF